MENCKTSCNRRPDPVRMTPSMLINDISKLFDNRIRRETERAGMSSGYRGIIFHLAHHDGITQHDLVRLTHMKAPSVSSALQKMESEGLVRRESNEKDMRQVLVYLTDAGREADEFIKCKCRETEAIMSRHFSDEEKAQLKHLLIKMMHNMLEEESEK